METMNFRVIEDAVEKKTLGNATGPVSDGWLVPTVLRALSSEEAERYRRTHQPHMEMDSPA